MSAPPTHCPNCGSDEIAAIQGWKNTYKYHCFDCRHQWEVTL